jgi:hypothetical protein
VALGLELADPGFEAEYTADGGEGHALVGEPDDVLNDGDLVTGVAALAAGGTAGLDDLVLVEPSQEGLLDLQQAGDLAHGEERQVRIVEGQRGHGSALLLSDC